MVVNETLARAFWPGKDPIGQCVVLERSSCTEVVGVVQNVGLFGRMDERGLYYLPATHPRVSATTPEALLVRVSRSTPTLAGAVRREIEGSAPEFTYVDVASYADLFAPELQPWRLGALMFTVFGILALGIATIGVYSVVAFVVTQQIHDIGVRVALGASRSDVVMQVVGNGMKPIVAGLFMGLVAALVGGRWLQPLLYHTEARDPQIICAVVGILAAAAAVACAVPAYRASRLNALVALRAE
jgi:ABC-type lipoprotein release transport system permease subunit